MVVGSRHRDKFGRQSSMSVSCRGCCPRAARLEMGMQEKRDCPRPGRGASALAGSDIPGGPSFSQLESFLEGGSGQNCPAALIRSELQGPPNHVGPSLSDTCSAPWTDIHEGPDRETSCEPYIGNGLLQTAGHACLRRTPVEEDSLNGWPRVRLLPIAAPEPTACTNGQLP